MCRYFKYERGQKAISIIFQLILKETNIDYPFLQSKYFYLNQYLKP